MLIDELYKRYVIKEKHTANVGGGYTTTWTDGATIQCALQQINSQEVKAAELQTLRRVSVGTFPLGTPIKYNDYIQSVDDASIVFRITSDPATPPASASLKYMVADLIRTELTT